MARSKRTRSEDTTFESKFVQSVEGFLAKTDQTNEEFMTEIKVSEAQFYRWKRGENVPTRSIVNRVAVFLARCLDEVHQELPYNPFPFSDKIDELLNELLTAAGHSASVQGKGRDSSWEEIASQESWRLGFTSDVDPTWIKYSGRPGDLPTGKAIEYADRVANLMGISTEWKYVPWENIPSAIAERQVHGMAPFMLTAPGRFFHYRFSEPLLGLGVLGLAAVTLPGKLKAEAFLEELPSDCVQLIYINNEIGSWMANLLNYAYKKNEPIVCTSKESAVIKLKTWKSELIPVLFIDSAQCERIATEHDWKIIHIKSMNDLKLRPAFVFHAEEEKLTTAVNSVVKMFDEIDQNSN